MPRIASFVQPLHDADLDELQRVAGSMGLSLRINGAARLLGKPAIELYAKRPRKLMIGTFRNASEALAWLQPVHQEASE